MSSTGEIGAPPRSSRFGIAVVIALILIRAMHDVWPDFLSEWLPFRALILVLPLAVVSRSVYAVHLNLLLLCLCIIKFFPHLTLFPFTYLTAFALYAYTILVVKELRHSVGWLRLGRFTSTVWMLILAII